MQTQPEAKSHTRTRYPQCAMLSDGSHRRTASWRVLAELTLQTGDTFGVLQENQGVKVLRIVVGAVPFHPGFGGCRGLWQRWDKGVQSVVQTWRAVCSN